VGLWGVNYLPKGGVEAIGLFNGAGSSQLVTQLYGVGAAFFLVFPLMLCVFLAIKYTVGLRVSEKEELEGLDIHEHGNEAYPPDRQAGISTAHAPVGTPGAPAVVAGTAQLAEGGAE